MLVDYEKEHPEPEQVFRLHMRPVVTVEEQLRHIEWLDQRWEFFKKYLDTLIK